MFCNACGSQLNADAQFCPLCGKPVSVKATPPAEDITAVIPAVEAAPDVTTPMPTAAQYPPAYPAPAPQAAPAPAPARPRSAAPVVIAIVVVVVLAMAGGALLLVRSGILGGAGARVEEGSSADADGASKDATKSTDGDVVIPGSDKPPTGDAVDITPGAANLSASTTLKGYPVGQTVDGKLDTCWAEGASGYGAGESITISMGGEVWVKEVRIVPGYLKNDTKNGVDRWYSNGRITRAKLVFSDGTDSAIFELNPDKKDFQSLALDVPVKTTSVQIVIVDTAPATTGTEHDAEDTSVSELKVFGFIPK